MEHIIIPLETIQKVTEIRKMTLEDFDLSIKGNSIIFKNFNCLKEFSKKANIPISHLFKLIEEEEKETLVKIGRRSENYSRVSFRKGIKYYTYTHLLTSQKEPNFMPLHIIVHASDTNEFVLNGGHESKEFVYVLKGQVRMHWNENEKLLSEVLCSGDSVHITPHVSHSFVSIGEVAEIIAINY